MENHLHSGKSVLINDRGQIVYHDENKAKHAAEIVGGVLDMAICTDRPFLGCSVYFDEEGLLKQLRMNEKATMYIVHQLPEARVLVGNVLLCPPAKDDSARLIQPFNNDVH